MEYYYIQDYSVVTTDTPIQEDLGTTLEDYIHGKYVQLNDEQIAYYKEHQNASPEEIFNMGPIDYALRIQTPYDTIFRYFDQEVHCIYINNIKRHCFDYKDILFTAELYKERNRDTMIFEEEGAFYRGNVDYIIQMMKDIALYYFDINLLLDQQYKYLDNHQSEIDGYDYQSQYPEIPHFTLEQVDSF